MPSGSSISNLLQIPGSKKKDRKSKKKVDEADIDGELISKASRAIDIAVDEVQASAMDAEKFNEIDDFLLGDNEIQSRSAASKKSKRSKNSHRKRQ